MLFYRTLTFSDSASMFDDQLTGYMDFGNDSFVRFWKCMFVRRPDLFNSFSAYAGMIDFSERWYLAGNKLGIDLVRSKNDFGFDADLSCVLLWFIV